MQLNEQRDPARGGAYAAAKRMTQEVEFRLYAYARMKRQLRNYRENCLQGTAPRDGEAIHGNLPGAPTETTALRLLEPAAGMQELQDWVQVIEQTWEEMREDAPELARVLEAVYGLTQPELRRYSGGSTRTRYTLMEELHISQTTLYNRKRACIDMVKDKALHRGLLCP